MRSRAVGIDKRQNGFVNLNIFQFVLLNFFKAIIGWDPPPAKLGAASNPPRRPRWCPPCAQPFFVMAKELCQWQLIGCYYFVMFITYNQLMEYLRCFSVMTVPLTKVSNHFLVLQTQIVLDTHTHRQTDFSWKPPLCQCKGKNKKSCCFWTFCLSQ